MKSSAVIVLLSIMAISLLPSPSPAALDIAVGMTASDVSLGEALLAAGVASFLGFQTHVPIYHRDTWNMPLPSVLTALLFSRMFDVDHHRIVGWRQRGQGWGRIANDLGVHPGAFNKLRRDLDIGRMGNDDFERVVMVWYLSQYYGVGQDRIHTWQRGGQSLLSILIALDLGAKSRRQVSDLFGARKSLPSWNSVADKIGVGRTARKHPQRPKGGSEYRSKAGRDSAGRSSSSTSAGGGQGRGNPR